MECLPYTSFSDTRAFDVVSKPLLSLSRLFHNMDCNEKINISNLFLTLLKQTSLFPTDNVDILLHFDLDVFIIEAAEFRIAVRSVWSRGWGRGGVNKGV